MIEQIISNALKYTSKGIIEIKVEEISNYENVIIIKDTGTGIEKEENLKIYLLNCKVQAKQTLR